jgi:hypothetical protein
MFFFCMTISLLSALERRGRQSGNAASTPQVPSCCQPPGFDDVCVGGVGMLGVQLVGATVCVAVLPGVLPPGCGMHPAALAGLFGVATAFVEPVFGV